MKRQYIIYILIGVFCIFALISGIYAEFFVEEKDKENIIIPNFNNEEEEEKKEKTQEEIKSGLALLFNNNLNAGIYDKTTIEKIKDEKDIVYEAYNIKKKQENYEVDIHLPIINIKGEVPKSFNDITQTIFANKASEVLLNKIENHVIYTINYTAYINEDILSVIIESTYKEGENAQRVIIQTYNYNLLTGEKVELADMLAKKNIIQSDCQNKINQVVTEAQQVAEIIVQSGYTLYNRNLTDKMYQIENVSTYFLGANGELYIVFAYGNQNYTSDMDIVLYE